MPAALCIWTTILDFATRRSEASSPMGGSTPALHKTTITTCTHDGMLSMGKPLGISAFSATGCACSEQLSGIHLPHIGGPQSWTQTLSACRLNKKYFITYISMISNTCILCASWHTLHVVVGSANKPTYIWWGAIIKEVLLLIVAQLLPCQYDHIKQYEAVKPTMQVRNRDDVSTHLTRMSLSYHICLCISTSCLRYLPCRTLAWPRALGSPTKDSRMFQLYCTVTQDYADSMDQSAHTQHIDVSVHQIYRFARLIDLSRTTSLHRW